MFRLILARDYVRLLTLQVLAAPLPAVPAGAIGRVIKVGPTGALVDFRPRYPPIPVNLTDLERASMLDLMPRGLQRMGGAFGRWMIAGPSLAVAAVIGALAERLVSHFFGC